MAWLGMVFLFLPGSASALSQATSNIVLDCTDGQLPNVSISESGPMPLSDTCLDSVDFGASGSRSASAAATTTFGASPTASAAADAGVTGIPGGGANADGLPAMQYQLQVTQIATPPVGGITEVPVTLAASGSASVSVPSLLSGASGESSVGLSGPGVSVLVGASDGSASFPSNSFNSLTAIPNIVIGSAYTLTIAAQCSADASSDCCVPTVVTAHCDSDASLGSISFDQAAFDLLMGASTFPLADFYAFDVSPNLFVPVPALGRVAFLLLVLGVAALGIASNTRRMRA
jgi:hypothetical protein